MNPVLAHNTNLINKNDITAIAIERIDSFLVKSIFLFSMFKRLSVCSIVPFELHIIIPP